MKTPPENLDGYIDDAKLSQGIKSDNQLGYFMGFQGTPISFWRTGKTWPRDDSMHMLAMLGGHDPQVALAKLGAWRTDGVTRTCYREIVKKLTQTAAMAFIFLAISSPSEAGTLTP